MQSTQIAIRNHQTGKLDELRIAALNSTLPNPPDDALQLIFLGIVHLSFNFRSTWLLKTPPGEPVIIIRRINRHAGRLKVIQ